MIGGLTGAINIMIVFPTEFVKTQLQLDTGREKAYSGSLDVVRQTVKQRGVTGMYRGVQVLLTGAIPTYALRSGGVTNVIHILWIIDFLLQVWDI